MRIEEYMKAGESQVVVDMPCTIHYYSDSNPAKVVKVSPSGKTCWIRKLKTEAPENAGMGHQDWIILDEFVRPELSEPDGYSFFKVTLRKDGSWRTSKSNLYVQMGIARKYYDWSF